MSSQVLKLEVVPAGTCRCTLSDGTETLEAVALSKVTLFGLGKLFIMLELHRPLSFMPDLMGLAPYFFHCFVKVHCVQPEMDWIL
jgi:hypothetical protein